MKTPEHPSPKASSTPFDRADYVLLFSLMLPLMMTIVNITMFEVGIPTIRDAFGIQADVAAWVVTAYSLPYMLCMPLYGRLGDELGKRRLFLAGITLFLLGSVMIPASPDLRLLLLGRVFQGMGAAGVSPLGMALITQHFPPEARGKALGTWNSIGPVSGIIGPLAGGFLIDTAGWRVMFAPILLLGALAMLTVHRRIAPSHQHISQRAVLRQFDWIGVLLLNVAVTLLMFYISSRPITGRPALQDWRLCLGAALAFLGFVGWEIRRTPPFIDLRIFRNPQFCLASLGSGIRMTVMGGLGFLMPLYLTDVHAVPARTIGLVTMMNAAALLLTLRFGGLLADRWPNRWPALIGASTQMAVVVYFASLPATASLPLVGAGLLAHGLGAGVALASLHRTSLHAVAPERIGMAAGLYSMMRFGVSALGIALAGVLLQQQLSQLPAAAPVIDAYQFVFRCLAAFAATGVVVAWNLRETSLTSSPHSH